jgi:holo-[acyl-carrier protein] synthase
VSEVARHRIGIDIESVKAMPDAEDFWQAPFYRAHFTPAEIAYSLLRTNPAQTFAGMWCAKEALKKAAQKWAGLDWLEIEILHDSLGRPYIRVQELEVGNSSLSISHTADFAVAVVVIAC